MHDVFVSYAREDRERARELAAALEAHGWSVWWDRKIVAGDTFDQTIEEQLDAARSVVVLWSEHSVESEWVRNEAGVAAQRDVLVPAMIDTVKLPLEFRLRHTVDLTDWSGDPGHGEFQSLCEAIAAKTRTPPPTPPPARFNWRAVRPIAAAAAAVFLIGIAAYAAWFAVWRDDDPAVDRLHVVKPTGSGAEEAGGQTNVPSIDLTGRWNAELRNTGQKQSFRISMDLETIDNRLIGTVHYPTGDGGIQDGDIEGNRIRFRTVHTPQFEDAPAEIRFDGQIVGETLELILQDAAGTARGTARRVGGPAQ